MESQAEGALEKLALRVQTDPVFHIEEVQGCTTLEGFQKQICRAVAAHERVAVSACHDVGKTFTSAKIVLWLASAFPGAKIITTAPTMQLVEMLLWSEIRNGYRLSKYPLGGRMLTTEWKIREDWFAIGLSPKEDSDGGNEGQGKGSSFQGVHGDLVVIVFDEATGVPPKRWIQAEGMMTSAHVKWLAIGNPTSRSTPFFRCFSSPAWHKIYLSCFDSPNLTANGVTNLEKLIEEMEYVKALPNDEAKLARLKSYKIVQGRLLTLKWVVEKAIDWGITHPLFVSKVLGRFPEDDDHVLMPLGVVEDAQAREAKPAPEDRHAIGVDVARYGTDKSVITHLHGVQLVSKKPLFKKSTSEVAGEVMAIIKGLGSRNIVVAVDGTGVGAGVVDALKEAIKELPESQRSIEIREVNFGAGFEASEVEDKKLYTNQKARLFVRLAKDLRKTLCLTQDSVYLEELPTILFKFDSKGRYVIESKDEYKKRTGRPSPDDADSLALANEARYPRAKVGTFAESMAAPAAAGGTVAPSLRSGMQW